MFRTNSIKLKINLFCLVLSLFMALPLMAADFGRYNGTPVANRAEILNQLNAKTGVPIIELLLSEGFRPKGSPIAPNPGGHLAVAVNGTAYSVSSAYKKRTDHLVCISPMSEYLYGTKDPSEQIPFGTGIGSCYVRTVWGIRIYKLPKKYNPKRIVKFWELANDKDSEEDERFLYKFRNNNCCSITARSLHYGGFGDYVGAKHLFDFPRDAVTDFLQELMSLPEKEVAWEIVRYDQVKTGQYWSSMYVPNLEWQRIWKNLPVFHHFFGKKTSLKSNCAREVYCGNESKEQPELMIRAFSKKSLLKRLMNRK